MTDPARLRQILVNLVGNAVKFTAAGRRSHRHPAMRNPGVEPKLTFAVIDTGIGIPAGEDRDGLQAVHAARRLGQPQVRGDRFGPVDQPPVGPRTGGRRTADSEVGREALTLTVATGPLDGVPMLERLSAIQEHQHGL